MIDQFTQDVDLGLSKEHKTLPSKYFYDEIGDDLFVQIMHMPEYYLTRAEYEIFDKKTDQIIDELSFKKDTFFELIELGAGDGTKTKKLLEALVDKGYDFEYIPVDISQNALDKLELDLENEIPGLDVKTRQGDYFGILKSLKDNQFQKVVLFLGSNLGNMNDQMAAEFIYRLGSNLYPGDKLLLGVDIIKDASIVVPAYNDEAGITEEFNLNLLKRINKELGGNFQVSSFKHVPEYIESKGIVKSYLLSTKDQDVSIDKTGKTYHFAKGERIHTEVSRKYNDEIIKDIIKDTDFVISGKLMDSKEYFADYILKRV